MDPWERRGCPGCDREVDCRLEGECDALVQMMRISEENMGFEMVGADLKDGPFAAEALLAGFRLGQLYQVLRTCRMFPGVMLAPSAAWFGEVELAGVRHAAASLEYEVVEIERQGHMVLVEFRDLSREVRQRDLLRRFGMQ